MPASHLPTRETFAILSPFAIGSAKALSDHLCYVCINPTLKFLCCADDPEFKAEAEALDWEAMDFGDELEAQVGHVWQQDAVMRCWCLIWRSRSPGQEACW